MRENYDLQMKSPPLSDRSDVYSSLQTHTLRLGGWYTRLSLPHQRSANSPDKAKAGSYISVALRIRVGQVIESQGEVPVIIIQYNALRRRDDPIEDDLIIYLFRYPDRTVIHFQTGYQHPLRWSDRHSLSSGLK